LESCIFSDNQANDPWNYNASGGAIYNYTTLIVKGCTFYGNSANKYGGAIYSGAYSHTSLTLTGNLFYGNTTTNNDNKVVYNDSYSGSVITSNGYNVADVAIGTWSSQSGWTATTGDTTFSGVGFSNNTTLPFVDIIEFMPLNTGTLRSHIPIMFSNNMPVTDFNGETRTWPGTPGAVK